MVVEPMYRRTLLLDENGLPYTTVNPLPVDATLTGATVYTVPPYCYSGDFTGDQADVVLVTPPLGKQLEAIGCFVTGQSAVFDLKIYFKTSGIVVQQHFVNGTLGAYIPTKLTGAINEPISLLINGSGVADKWFVVVNYALVPP